MFCYTIKKINLLVIGINCIDLDKAVAQVLGWVKVKKWVYICVAPVAPLVDAKRDHFYV